MTFVMPEIISREQARALGLTKFFDGTPCPTRGHLGARYVKGGACSVCISHRLARSKANPNPAATRQKLLRIAAWKKRNPEKIRQYQARYKERNREKISQRQSLALAENRHGIRERQALRRYLNRNKLRQQSRDRYAKNPKETLERIRAWKAANRERVLAREQQWRDRNRERVREVSRAVKARRSVLVGIAKGLGLGQRVREVRETKTPRTELDRKAAERRRRVAEGREKRKRRHPQQEKLYREQPEVKDKTKARARARDEERKVLAEIAKALLTGEEKVSCLSW